MDEYEKELGTLAPADLMWRLEELTNVLAHNVAKDGDFHRQMLVKRVILRKLSDRDDSVYLVRFQQHDTKLRS